MQTNNYYESTITTLSLVVYYNYNQRTMRMIVAMLKACDEMMQRISCLHQDPASGQLLMFISR